MITGGPNDLTTKICKGPTQFQYFVIVIIRKTSIFPSRTTRGKKILRTHDLLLKKNLFTVGTDFNFAMNELQTFKLKKKKNVKNTLFETEKLYPTMCYESTSFLLYFYIETL